MEDSKAYPAKVLPDVQARIAHMAGRRGVELDPKSFFKMNTALTTSPQLMAFALTTSPQLMAFALTTSPQLMAFALKPKFSKAEAMERMRRRMGV